MYSVVPVVFMPSLTDTLMYAFTFFPAAEHNGEELVDGQIQDEDEVLVCVQA